MRQKARTQKTTASSRVRQYRRKKKLLFRRKKTGVVGGAVCKSNCCCCRRCAEQLHSREEASSSHNDGATLISQPRSAQEQNFPAPDSPLNSDAHSAGRSSSSDTSKYAGDESCAEAAGGGGGKTPSLNNYLTIKELHDIEEEDDQLEEDPISESSSSLLTNKPKTSVSTLSAGYQQPHLLQKCESRKKKRNLRTRSATSNSSTSSEYTTTCGSPGISSIALNKMQAEQGSIGDLQKYHNRYLRSRRHTLANVR